MMVAIFNSAILNFFHLGFRHLSFPLRLLTLAKIGSHYLHKKTFTHSFWLNLMIAAIVNSSMSDWASAILDSDTLLSFLGFTQKYSHSILTLTQTNSIWLKLIHSHLTWWWQPSWTLPGWIFSILDSAILVSSKTPYTCQDWFPLFAQKKLHLFILTQLDDCSHHEFFHVRLSLCHLGFRHLVIFSWIYSKTLSLHSDSDSN